VPNVFALIRFSFINKSGQGHVLTTGKSIEERIAAVFAPERMARRFELFEAICLPSLKAQNPDHFHAILLVSSHMPNEYLERLEALVEKTPNISIAVREPGFVPYLFGTAIAELVHGDAPTVTVRLDDDDALAADYSDRVQKYLIPAHHEYCLTFAEGYDLTVGQGALEIRPNYAPCIAAGLGMISTTSQEFNIYHCGIHVEIPKNFPTLIDTSARMFVRTRHDMADTSAHPKNTFRVGYGPCVPVTEEPIEPDAPERFAFLDGAALKALAGQ